MVRNFYDLFLSALSFRMIFQRNVGKNIKGFHFRKGAVEIDYKVLIDLHGSVVDRKCNLDLRFKIYICIFLFPNG
jgi:hypothetical protein